AELLDDDVEEGRRPTGPDPRELLARDDAAERTEDELRPADEAGRGGPRAPEQPHVVGPGRQRDGRLVGLPPVPDALDVEGLDLEAAADLAAGQLGVVVGVVRGADELDAVLHRGVDEVADAVDEGLLALAAGGPARVTDRRLEVRQRLLA